MAGILRRGTMFVPISSLSLSPVGNCLSLREDRWSSRFHLLRRKAAIKLTCTPKPREFGLRSRLMVPHFNEDIERISRYYLRFVAAASRDPGVDRGDGYP